MSSCAIARATPAGDDATKCLEPNSTHAVATPCIPGKNLPQLMVLVRPRCNCHENGRWSLLNLEHPCHTQCTHGLCMVMHGLQCDRFELPPVHL